MDRYPAPIVLFAYNRPWHLRQTLEALMRNHLAENSRLIVYSDGPRSERDQDAVAEVRAFLKGMDGFRKIELVEHDRNLGLQRSIFNGVSDVVERYGRVIVMEDDLVTSPHFLSYMNDALELYEHEEDVISVHGYVYPVKGTLPETFFLRGADCWGWGTWSRGWSRYVDDGALLLTRIRDGGLEKSFDMDGAYPYTRMLADTVSGRVSSWAVKWYASAFLEGRLTLYPGRSLVQHIGKDGSGTNFEASDMTDVQLTKGPVKVHPVDIMENKHARLLIAEFLSTMKPSPGHRILDFARRNARRILKG
jgi:hypothetical protein